MARELISKTKWIASKGAPQIDTQIPGKLLHAKGEGADKPSSESARLRSNRLSKRSALGEDMPPSSLTAEPESTLPDTGNLSDSDRVSPPPKPRSRMFSILHRKNSSRSRTHNTVSSEGSFDVRDSVRDSALLFKRSNFCNSLSHLVIVLTPSLPIHPPINLRRDLYRVIYVATIHYA